MHGYDDDQNDDYEHYNEEKITFTFNYQVS